jgi:hypothetical protein
MFPSSCPSLPQAEWEARQAAEAALDAAGDAPAEEDAADAADKDHWEEEKELCKQLLMYLRRLVPAEKTVEEEVEVGGIDPERRIETEEDNGRSLGMGVIWLLLVGYGLDSRALVQFEFIHLHEFLSHVCALMVVLVYISMPGKRTDDSCVEFSTFLSILSPIIPPIYPIFHPQPTKPAARRRAPRTRRSSAASRRRKRAVRSPSWPPRPNPPSRCAFAWLFSLFTR